MILGRISIKAFLVLREIPNNLHMSKGMSMLLVIRNNRRLNLHMMKINSKNMNRKNNLILMGLDAGTHLEVFERTYILNCDLKGCG